MRFAGTLTPHNGAWVWEHEMNIRPEEMGQKDSGFLRFTDDSGNMMIENCVDGTYSEEWERIDDAAQTGGCGLLFRSARGMMVVAGAHFIMVRNSEDPLLEISHGAAAGAMNTWLITNSTLPWCEGEVLVRPDEIWYAAP